MDLRTRLFKRILPFKLPFFDRTPVGTLVTRHVSDINGISNVFSNGILNAVGDLLALTVTVVAMFVLDWRWALLALAPIPVLIWATRLFQKAIKKAFVDVRNQVARMNEFVQEHVTGMHIVQAFNREEREAERFEALNEAHRAANIRSIWAFSVFFPVVELLSAGSVALLLWFGLGDVVTERMTLGVLLQFILYVFMLYRPIRQLADRFNVLQMGIVNSERVFKLLRLDEEMADHGTAADTPFHAEIVFEDVWFAYQNEDWVLKGVSFTIEPGSTVAFVGATGAGKSTVISLICRFYEPQKGRITIDGVDLRDIPLDTLRTRVGLVAQDVFLFSDSLRNNVTLYEPSVSDAVLDEAARAVGADSFIDQLPARWDMPVRERGASLSVGQRQLIAFMRASVTQPSVLVLDEATSSIDSESERLIQEATRRITKGRTSLVVAHRLSTIQEADAIFVFDSGQITERGTHSELLVLGGTYHTLYNKQFTALP
jgi:ATP-binding cassette subfamily B protein